MGKTKSSRGRAAAARANAAKAAADATKPKRAYVQVAKDGIAQRLSARLKSAAKKGKCTGR